MRHLSRSLATLLLAGPLCALAADWHVAPGGSASGDGSTAAPLDSLATALTRSANGDTILFERGGEYPASNLSVGGNRTLTAYGTGAQPVLTAAVEVSLPGTWTQNAMVRTGPVTGPVLAVYVDGRFVPLARYPNTGFLHVDNDDSPDTIVDSELSARPGVTAGRWTGAQVRWRRWSWWWETRPITSHSPVDTLALGPEGRFQDPFSDPGSGYFIDNSLDELDAPGEWFWGGGTLYLYPPTWANPAAMRVTVVTTTDTGLTSNGATFRSLHFDRYAGTALQLGRPSTVEDCTFSELETNAVAFTYDAQPFTVRTSVFRDVRNVAISGWANAAGAAGSLIERNLFLRIGVERGYGGSGSWHAAGVIVGRANAAVVRLNRFVETGYAGVILGSDGQTVEHNVFVRTMRTLNDGAAVYTNCNASIIRENVILDTVGDLETSHPWWPLGHGIWPEFLSNFRDTQILDNTIYGSNGFGIFLPNNFTATLAGNHAVDDRRAGLSLSGNASDDQANTITGNVLAAVSPTRRVARPENLTMWWLPPYPAPKPVALEFETGLDYGSMTGTAFVTPTGADFIREQGGAAYTTLSAWTSTEPSWADATGSSLVRANAYLLFNDTESSADVPVPAGTWTLVDGTAVGATVPLAPFHSVVLVTTGAAPTSPPYVAASGIDWRQPEPTTAVLTPTPEIDVRRGGTSVPNGGTDDLGAVPVAALTPTWDIANEGGVALTLSPPVTVSNETQCAVTVTAQPAATVPSGGTSPLTVSVTPAAAGPFSFQLSLANGDADENPSTWTVTGTASDTVPPDAGTRSDGGVAPGTDGGTATDAAIGACGCGPGSAAPGWWLALLAVALLGVRHRNRPAR